MRLLITLPLLTALLGGTPGLAAQPGAAGSAACTALAGASATPRIGTFKHVEGEAWLGSADARCSPRPGDGLRQAERARTRAGGEIVITGHTDRQGSVADNDRLSLQRAQAVRALLIERGFAAELVQAIGRGEREPLLATEDEVVEPRNRRADVLVR